MVVQKRLAASMEAKQVKAASAQINHEPPLERFYGDQNMAPIPVLIEQVEDTQTDLQLQQIQAVIGLHQLLISTRRLWPRSILQWFKHLSERTD